MRVFVIEDDIDVCEAIKAELVDAGHEVTSAPDGAVALEKLLLGHDTLPDVILLDLMMQNLDGKSFRIRQLAEPRIASIPTLIITAKPIDQQMRSSVGDTPIIAKPFDSAVLLAAMEEVVQPRLPTKRCACGHVYDDEAWQSLRFVGEVDNGREVGERLELRLCVCGTTLAWQLGKHAVSLPMIRIK